MVYLCRDEGRRNAVRAQSAVNGIDYVEVIDNIDPPLPLDERQRTLEVHFINPAPPPEVTAITPANVMITGGERITGIRADRVSLDGNVLAVHLDARGDYSTYTLKLVEKDAGGEIRPLAGLDPLFSSIDFWFKVECPSEFDCKARRVGGARRYDEPSIDYLAKDYASFRQLALDRLSALMPEWKERSAADLGVALSEILAYVGDYLSYRQDAIATEAYLGTAQHRVSVRRHARLVDYFMHDGCNARTWVHVRASADGITLKKGTPLLTRIDGAPARISQSACADWVKKKPEVFETLHELVLFQAHNELRFHTWGNRECCLPSGSTRAFLVGKQSNLKKSDVLIFEEVVGPKTGNPADADAGRRHPVRLSKEPSFLVDELYPDPTQPGGFGKLDVTEIEWAPEDKLPFPLCISTRIESQEGSRYVPDVSVARANIVLADHGRTISEEQLGAVPAAARFRPGLIERPLTHAATVPRTDPPDGRTRRLAFDPDAPAAAAFQWEMRDVLPAVSLNEGEWEPRSDLLGSDPNARDFVVETEADGTSYLRFGDDQFGLRPASGTQITATYRVGNGTGGNVGAESLAHIVSDDPAVEGARNPLAAQGGRDPQSIEEVRQSAPSAFGTQERAVTQEDYAEVAGRLPSVQHAVATFGWTGSWRTVFVTVDRLGGLEVDELFKDEMRRHLERYRMAGQDAEIDSPIFVPLELEIQVRLRPGYLWSDVKAAVADEFSNRVLPDGRLGAFHPDRLTFAQPVYLSQLYAAAQSVEGVAWVEITKLARRTSAGPNVPDDGYLAMGRLEIARLDNDPSLPDRGVLRVVQRTKDERAD